MPTSFAGPLRFAGRALKGTLSIVQWEHVVPAYDVWLDTWAARWGERNDVAVEIERVPYTRLPQLAAAEAKAGKGHDVFGFLSPPAAYEDDVLDHADVVREVERAWPLRSPRQAKHLQPDDEAVLRHLGQLRAEPGPLAP